MLRKIVGFAADDAGDWVALLECHHRQHVRHRPPFRPASWVEDQSERDRRIGTTLNCPLCDRCELPDGLIVVRTTATWDERTMPDALRRAHRVASGAWGRLRVEDGSLRFVARTNPITDVIVESDLPQGIPPDVERQHANSRCFRTRRWTVIPRLPDITNACSVFVVCGASAPMAFGYVLDLGKARPNGSTSESWSPLPADACDNLVKGVKLDRLLHLGGGARVG